MEKRKLTKADIDKVRNIEGFPIAKDEDIIELSDPPYYTACPNPFVEDFIREYGKPYDEASDDYHREPFAADVSEGKNDPIYNAHSYHTKVPHKAIMRYILHYTKPGDIVFDGFCGTGMTGVAARLCANPDLDFKCEINKSMPYIQWGQRKAILNDLAPAATFISRNYNSMSMLSEFKRQAERVIDACEKELGWIYQTYHVDNRTKQISLTGGSIMGKINYTVWSDVFICPNCGNEFVFWDVAIDKNTKSVQTNFSCPQCSMLLKKSDCEHAILIYHDPILRIEHTINKQVPVLINYSIGTKRYEKRPDQHDLDVLEKINNIILNQNLKTYPMLHKGGSNWGEIWRAGYHYGVTHSHHFYTFRNYYALNLLWTSYDLPTFRWAITAILNYVNKKQSYTGGGGGMPGVLYIASLIQEKNVFDVLRRKVKSLLKILSEDKSAENCCAITTGSSTQLSMIPENSIDYIFVDPPFGGNIMYSEASFLWECWLGVFSNNKQEAIESRYQRKSLLDYQDLMMRCFTEFSRILKPGRWMTVEFHNSQNSVWNSIREALLRAGFIVADVRVLDKKQGSFKQVTSQGAVKQDLVISAYKPKDSFKRDFISQAGSEETAWSFVRQHLENLPVAVVKNGKIELITERQAFLLFDRMVAYHIINGISVPLDASDFYRGLDEKFLKRDGMYFLADQVNEYDTARIMNDVEPIEFQLFVTNEKSAIAWLYQQLATPQTYAELQPKFMQEIKTIDKYEAMPELSVLLEDNFLQDDKGKWYIPDRTKEADIAKLREKKLLKEFEGYLATKGKIKLFRTEAIRVGFAKLWADKNYKLIVETAGRLPEDIIQEDDKLLMYYDLSLGRV